MTIYCKFTVESAYERILKPVNFWRSCRQESWLSHVLFASGHCPAERWRTRQRSWVWQETAVVNCYCIDCYWVRQLPNWCRLILTCQLTSSEILTERWWCAKGFCCEAFFFVAAAAYSQLFCGL